MYIASATRLQCAYSDSGRLAVDDGGLQDALGPAPRGPAQLALEVVNLSVQLRDLPLDLRHQRVPSPCHHERKRQ